MLSELIKLVVVAIKSVFVIIKLYLHEACSNFYKCIYLYKSTLNKTWKFSIVDAAMLIKVWQTK